MNRSLALRRAVACGAAAALALAFAAGASAHHGAPHETNSKAAGLADGAPVSLQGRLSVLDFIYLNGAGHERIYAIVGDDGSATRVQFAAGVTVRAGARLVATGHAVRGAVIVDQHQVQPAPKSAAAITPRVAVEGTMQLLHADYFEGGTTHFIWTLRQDSGESSELDLPIAPTELRSGMRVSVTGERNTAGIAPDSIAVLAEAPAKTIGPVAAASTAKVLVILLNFKGTAKQPFTPAAVEGVVFSDASSIANYWKEVSFGNQLMTGTVTPWLTASFAIPATCDYPGIATEARRLATAAGYVLSSYQKVHYLFERVPACGWAGLGEVPGSQTWSNQYNTLGVIGHELGHNLGLGHANSLPCNGATIGTNCPLGRPEYGDPWDIMGNVSSRSVNAWQKNDLGWVPDAAVATHTGGTSVYTLSPLTSPGGTLYAVQVPAAVHRTYWLEYRQATGFDAGLPASATNGAIVHLGGTMHQSDRSEYGCWDTCFLDMNPATTTMTDGTLQVGSAFTDAQTGVTISALSKGAGGLTVSVASPSIKSDLGLYRKLSPTGTGVYKFMVDWGFDFKPDAQTPYGMAGDIPLVGNFTYDGLTSFVVYRNGIWYIDKTRDGKSDQTVILGGVAGDIPLAANFTGSGYTDDLVLYRSGTWYVDQYLNGTVDKTFRFGGVPGDKPLAGDINGDGIADLVIYRNGFWYIDTNRDGVADMTVIFGGMPQDIPFLLDWDGDGKADLCLYRDGMWFVNTKRDGTVQAMFQYGAAGDIPFGGHFY